MLSKLKENGFKVYFIYVFNLPQWLQVRKWIERNNSYRNATIKFTIVHIQERTVLHHCYLLFLASLSPLSLYLLFRFCYPLLLFAVLSVSKYRVMIYQWQFMFLKWNRNVKPTTEHAPLRTFPLKSLTCQSCHLYAPPIECPFVFLF